MVEETRDSHDIGMQREMWSAFCKIVRWSIIGVAAVLILMALTLT